MFRRKIFIVQEKKTGILILGVVINSTAIFTPKFRSLLSLVIGVFGGRDVCVVGVGRL